MLKVKVIDRKYKDGRYYSTKVVVYDVLPDSIVCKTDSGRLLEGIVQFLPYGIVRWNYLANLESF